MSGEGLNLERAYNINSKTAFLLGHNLSLDIQDSGPMIEEDLSRMQPWN